MTGARQGTSVSMTLGAPGAAAKARVGRMIRRHARSGSSGEHGRPPMSRRQVRRGCARRRRRRHAGDRRGAACGGVGRRRGRGDGGDGRAGDRRHRAAAADGGGAAACDVFIAPTTRSLSHTEARKRASDAGVRGATMPGVSADMLARVMDVDFDLMAARSAAVARLLQKSRAATITCPLGTDLTSISPGERGSPTTAI